MQTDTHTHPYLSTHKKYPKCCVLKVAFMTSLEVQWLQLCASAVGVQILFLVGELGCHMPWSLARKMKKVKVAFICLYPFVNYIEEMLRFGNVNDWPYYHGTWWSCWILRVGKNGGKDGKNSRLLEKPYSRDRRRKWQPTPVFLPGESQGWGSLVGFCLWGHTESDMTEVT